MTCVIAEPWGTLDRPAPGAASTLEPVTDFWAVHAARTAALLAELLVPEAEREVGGVRD